MKTIFRASIFGLVTAAFMAVSAVSTFAQNPCDDTYETKQAFYGTFREGRKEPRNLDKAKAGIKAGDEFLAKYGTCEEGKEVATFVKDKLPELKEWVKFKELTTRFDNSIKDGKNVNADEAYSSGKEILSLRPALAFDMQIALASVGYDGSVKNPPADKYNVEAINFGKKAIADIEAGKTSESWGFLSQSFVIRDAQKKVDQAKSKQNTLGWLNYMLGSIMYYNQKMPKDAVPFFYQATKFDSPTKNKPDVYRAIGAWYLEEILRMDKERTDAITANGNKDNEATLAMFALIKGYADRAIDAYARAYKLAPTSETTYRTSLKDKLQALYKIRFDNTNGIDAYIATVMNKPMPDPASPVEPVKEEVPADTTTTTSSTTTNTTTTTTKPSTTTTKPDTTTKPSTDTTKPATDTTKPTTTVKPSTGKTTTKPKTTKKKSTR